MRLQLEDLRVAVLQFGETLGRRSPVGVLCSCSSNLIACRLSLRQRLLVWLDYLSQPSHGFAGRDDLRFVILHSCQLRKIGHRRDIDQECKEEILVLILLTNEPVYEG